jgi:hypothetical protein
MAGIYEDEILGAQQSRDLARKLRETEIPSTGHMIGDWYVAPTVAQQLSAVLKQGIGAYKENQAEDELKGLRTQRLKDVISAKQGLGIPATQQELEAAGTPAQKPSVFSRIGGALGIIDKPQGTPAVPMQQPPLANFETLPQAQQATAMSNAAGIIPTEAGAYMTIKEHQATREAAKQKQLDDIAARIDLQTERILSNEQMAADRLETQRSIQAMIQANRPERQAPQGSIVEIIDPNDPTKMIKMNTLTREVYGTSGAEPKAEARAVKEQAKIDEQAKGQESFQSTLYDLKGEYDKLKSLGSMKSDQESSIANALGVKLKTSTGQLLGTETGTAISNIEQARKSIIQDIKTATGMSAGQLNSNFELQNMLDTVTNPDSSYEAVQDQLNTMSKKFGTGEAIFPERLKFKQQANMIQRLPSVAPKAKTEIPVAPVNPDDELAQLRAKHGG